MEIVQGLFEKGTRVEVKIFDKGDSMGKGKKEYGLFGKQESSYYIWNRRGER